jgi:hypothetical protein
MMKGIPALSVSCSVTVHIWELWIQKETYSFFTNCDSLIPYFLFRANIGLARKQDPSKHEQTALLLVKKGCTQIKRAQSGI